MLNVRIKKGVIGKGRKEKETKRSGSDARVVLEYQEFSIVAKRNNVQGTRKERTGEDRRGSRRL